MKQIKRPLVGITIILLILVIIYDIFSEKVEYSENKIRVAGIITKATRYEGLSGIKYRLQLEWGKPPIKKIFLIVKENLLKKSIGDREDVGEFIYGRSVSAIGSLKPFMKPTNLGQFDTKTYYENEGFCGNLEVESISIERQSHITSLLWLIPRQLNKIKVRVLSNYKKILPSRETGILAAMLLGDKTEIDEEIRELYQGNSISHILAISGLHISLIGGIIYTILKKMKIGHKKSIVASMLILLFYGMMTGFAVSTARAIIMIYIFFLSLLLKRSYDIVNATAISTLVLLLINHRLIYQSSFQLSFLAVVGIFFISPSLEYIFNQENNKKNLKNLIIKSIICSISINIATFPIILYNYYEISLLGILLNIIVIPLMSFLVITGLAGGIIGNFLGIGNFILGTSYFILILYERICRIAINLPINRMILGSPSLHSVCIYYIVVFLSFYFISLNKRVEKYNRIFKINKKTGRKEALIVGVFSLIIGIIILIPRKTGNFVDMLDIGQGDCFVIRQAEKVYISDCGSTSVGKVGKNRLIPFLKYKGISKVKGVIVSHLDLDHVNGVMELIEDSEIQIDKIFISIAYKNNAEIRGREFDKLLKLAHEKGVVIRYLKALDIIKDGNLKLTCIYPRGDEKISDPNEGSIVMKLELEGTSVLFTGDAGEISEFKILKEINNDFLKSDVLKVGHHGSKNSSNKEFLSKISPRYFLISCGNNNRYGHPHRESIERIKAQGGKILRTDLSGGISLELRGREIHYKRHID